MHIGPSSNGEAPDLHSGRPHAKPERFELDADPSHRPSREPDRLGSDAPGADIDGALRRRSAGRTGASEIRADVSDVR